LYSALASETWFQGLALLQPAMQGVALHSADGTVPSFQAGQVYGVPEAQAAWYASQMFIGHNMGAVIA
ncbi:hypothetical protein B5S45_19910, partial [Morganella morganii]